MKLKYEAKNEKTEENDGKIWGWKISGTNQKGLLRIIEDISKKPFAKKPWFLVTAYSEFFLEVINDPKFAQALFQADQILPDGVSIPAAVDFLKTKSGIWWKDLALGARIGWKILHGEYTMRTIIGVKLVKTLLEAGKYRIYLLGGKPGTAKKLAKVYGCGWDEGGDINNQEPKTNNQIIQKIQNYKPDILLVAYGRFKQEKWIANNLGRLNTKVVMGVGSSFDELAGIGPWSVPCPNWVEKHGLKWLWRVSRDPKHLMRAIRAAVVFPVRIYLNPLGFDKDKSQTE